MRKLIISILALLILLSLTGCGNTMSSKVNTTTKPMANNSKTALPSTDVPKNIDNTCGNSVGNIINVGIVAQSGDWVYYTNLADSASLYKIRTDSSERIKLSDDWTSFINVMNDWVYYTNASDGNKVYKIRTNGSKKTKLNDDNSNYISVLGDWVYYSNDSDNDKFYKIRTDGSQRQLFG